MTFYCLIFVLLTTFTTNIVNADERTPESVIKKFREDALAEHNKYRSLHGVPPLKLSEERQLNSVAQKIAQNSLEKDKFIFGASPYGQNLYGYRSSNNNNVIPASFAVKTWYDSINNYDFSNPEGNDYMKTGGFTAVVWKSTTELGIGYAAKNGIVYVVAKYSPGGNINTRYGENVKPPLKH